MKAKASKSFQKNLLWLFSLLFLVSCSHFSRTSSQANSYLRSGDYDKAIDVLKPLAEEEGDDQLVYLLDYGMALHLAGKYDESIKAFLKADDIAALKDYHSISKVAASILMNEGMVQYKGDDFEKVFIHVYLALDFLMKNDLDGALVETRRTNEVLQKYRDEGKKNYDQNAFAFYLSGIIWEADRKWDDAYISYKDALNQEPRNKVYQKDAYRLAKMSSRMDELGFLFKKHGINITEVAKRAEENPIGKGDSELIFIYQQGPGPIKKPHPDFPRIPKLYPQATQSSAAKVYIKGLSSSLSTNASTKEIYNVSDVAIKTLDDQYAGLIAKRAAGIAAKYAAAKQVGKKNELLGAVAWIGLNLTDQADLRQWSTLPGAFQVARIKLPPGEYEISAESIGPNGNALSEEMSAAKVKIKAQQKTFITWRSYN
ncbi:MAG: hypothetical protein V4596_09615 [Bdellovibrionota bacterium]